MAKLSGLIVTMYAILMVSCIRIIDYAYVTEYIYENKSGVDIKLLMIDTYDNSTEEISIPLNSNYIIELEGDYIHSPFTRKEKVEFIFNGEKKAVFNNGQNNSNSPFYERNYELEMSKKMKDGTYTHYRYTYIITEEMYESAESIEP